MFFYHHHKYLPYTHNRALTTEILFANYLGVLGRHFETFIQIPFPASGFGDTLWRPCLPTVPPCSPNSVERKGTATLQCIDFRLEHHVRPLRPLS